VNIATMKMQAVCRGRRARRELRQVCVRVVWVSACVRSVMTQRLCMVDCRRVLFTRSRVVPSCTPLPRAAPTAQQRSGWRRRCCRRRGDRTSAGKTSSGSTPLQLPFRCVFSSGAVVVAAAVPYWCCCVRVRVWVSVAERLGIARQQRECAAIPSHLPRRHRETSSLLSWPQSATRYAQSHDGCVRVAAFLNFVPIATAEYLMARASATIVQTGSRAALSRGGADAEVST
jgi:hypothetical protein